MNNHSSQILKMAGLGKQVSELAHELKNGLSNISCATQLSQTIEPDIKTILIKESQRCSTIMKHILYFARKEDEQNTTVDLNTLFVSLFTIMHQNIYLKSIKANCNVGHFLISTIPDSLKIIFLNLISNAIQAMDQGGELIVCAYKTKNGIRIEISDTGCGIPEDIQEKIFEDYFSTKGDQGNGLGLSLVKKEINKIGAKISLKSKPNIGSVFRVLLPSTQQATMTQ